MKLTTEMLKKIIKEEIMKEYSGEDAYHDMAYGTDSRKKPAPPAASPAPEPEKLSAKAQELLRKAMDGDPDAVAMLMSYGE
tara:strand:- start:1261 stop:1503 length:243 start_codon:yes stop_codon:yes gene_type:complete